MRRSRSKPSRPPSADRSHSETWEQIERRRWKNNVLGLITLLLIIVLAADVGGWAGRLGNLLLGK